MSRFTKNIHLGLFSREAVRALARNKLRSSLSAVGIAIGIAAVVCVAAIGTAGSRQAEAQLQNLGDNFIWIEAGSRNVNGVRSGTHGMNTLTLGDAEAIRRNVPYIKAVSPHVDGNVLVAAGPNNWTTHYRGVSPEFFAIRRWGIAEGGPFSKADDRRVADVCLLGSIVRQKLFADGPAVGQYVRINKQPFRVLGVLAVKGQTPTGYNQDDTILLPYTTVQKKLRGKGYDWLDDIMASAVSRDAINPAIEEITGILRDRHHIRPGQPDDFNIRHPGEIIKAQIAASRTLTFFLVSIASISLLVGGIGIMNVMLVSVTERTREIGIRMAVGATAKAIQAQFLGEAVMLSLFGGFFGSLAGVAGSYLFGYALGWPVSIPLEGLVIAPAFAIGVGVSFGFYPAWRASRLDPITAIRHER